MSREVEILASIRQTPIPAIITDPRLPDNPICAVNSAFEALTGYPADELIGRNCRLLAGPATDRNASRRLAEAIVERRPTMVELLNYRRDGSMFLNAVMIAPMFDDDGELIFFVGSQMDVSASRLRDAADRRKSAVRQLALLTSRQREVLTLISRGLRNRQIAAELGINEKTVEKHRADVLDRLGVATSTQAIRLAVEGEL